MIQGCPNGETHESEPLVPTRESIAREEGTRGTETSKYPEERKENSIPLVVANETGTAQTASYGKWGCRTSNVDLIA